MAERYDAIVIGGGHNGLTCGAYLARAGLKRLGVARRPRVGGAPVSDVTIRGYTFSRFSVLMSRLHPQAIPDLARAEHVIRVLPASDRFGPLPHGDHVVRDDSEERTHQSSAPFRRKDPEIYQE